MDNKRLSERPKRIYKFNVIDFVLIVVILAAVLLLVYIMLGNNLLAGKENTTIIYTIEIDVLKNEFISAVSQITPGTKVIDSIRSYDIGEIQSVKISDSYVNMTDLETGVVNRKPFPDHSKVVITVKAKCVKDKVRYTVNGKTIMVGVQINFRTPYFISYGTCRYLEEVNEDGSKKVDAGIETETGGNTEGE